MDSNHPHNAEESDLPLFSLPSSLSKSLLRPSSHTESKSKQLSEVDVDLYRITMGNRPKRSIQELQVQDVGVQGLKVSDFEDLSEDSSQSSACSMSVSSTNSTSGYFCIGGGSNSLNSSPCLTREFNQLPMTRREQVDQDLYGMHSVDEAISPELLEQLEREIEKIDNVDGNREAYDCAVHLSPSYVHSESFRTMFLRATEGDCKKTLFHKEATLWGSKVSQRHYSL
jgi:hypothetical protein